MKNSSIYEMLYSIATEFGTEVPTIFNDTQNFEVEFSRPLAVKKTPRNYPLAFIESFGSNAVEGVGTLIYVKGVDTDGDDLIAPLQGLSFTDRLRVLRRAVRVVEKIVKDK